jgi:hypothetical protein
MDDVWKVAEMSMISATTNRIEYSQIMRIPFGN